MAAPGPRVARPGLEYGSAGPSGPWPQQRPSPQQMCQRPPRGSSLWFRPMELPRVILMGHSWGSLIALAAAAQLGERISHLGLIGTASPMAVAPGRCSDLAQKQPGEAIALIDKYSRSPVTPADFDRPSTGPRGAGQQPCHQSFALRADRVQQLPRSPRGHAASDRPHLVHDRRIRPHDPPLLLPSR